MLRKRLIFALVYSDGYFNQSRNFKLQKVGDLKWLEKNYNFKSVSRHLDEIIILNASRGESDHSIFCNTVREIAKTSFIPVSAGGKIKSMNDVSMLFTNGADKIIFNSTLIENPNLVLKTFESYGSSSIVASIDLKINKKDDYEIYINNGKTKLDLTMKEYLKYIEELNVGEIYINSIDRDGTGFGYDLSLFKKINEFNIPVIIGGGAGNSLHFEDALKLKNIDAVSTANLFNFMNNSLQEARQNLIFKGFNLSNWE